MKELESIVRDLIASGEGGVLATLVTAEGSSYRRPGARLFVSNSGNRIGSISGGCLEDDVLLRGKAVEKSGTPEVVIYDTTSENDLVWGVGLGCHGVVRVLIERLGPQPPWASAVAENLRHSQSTELAVVWQGGEREAALGTKLRGDGPECPGIFYEVISPAPRLVIFGAGDDARPLVRLAKEFGWRVTIADPRPYYAAADRFPGADQIICAPAHVLAGRAAPGPDALAVIMTHHYVHDVPILRDLLRLPLAYLGLLGPKKRTEKILDDLSASGSAPTAAQRARLRTPVGLDLGGDTPESVALSVVAEMHAVLAGRDGRPLRERQGPIHE